MPVDPGRLRGLCVAGRNGPQPDPAGRRDDDAEHQIAVALGQVFQLGQVLPGRPSRRGGDQHDHDEGHALGARDQGYEAHDQGAEAGEQVLILLTDGANTAGEIDPLKAAELAQQIGLRIYTIGIGAEQMVVSSITGGMRRVNPSADLDEETLTKIADQTGGRYFRAKDTAGLQEIYRLLDEMEPVAEPEAGFRPVKSLYYWPLGGAFVLALFLATMNRLAGLRLARAGRVKLNA